MASPQSPGCRLALPVMSPTNAASRGNLKARRIRAAFVAVILVGSAARAADPTETAATPPGIETPAATTSTATATAAATPAPSAPRLGVTFRGQPIFFVADDGTPEAKRRAAALSESLGRALEASTRAHPDAPDVDVVLTANDVLSLSVRGHPVGSLDAKDAAAAGVPTLDAYRESLRAGLRLFVADQRRKTALQGTALRVAIAVAAMLVALLLVRFVRHLAGRIDEYLDERSTSMRPIRVFGVPIVGPETLSASAALLTSAGRILAYLSLVATGLAVALYQFEWTRPWVDVGFRWGSQRFVHAAEELILALPRVVLAAFLIVLGSAGLRVARVLFDDSADTQTPWGKVPAQRARVLRTLVPIGIFAVIVPLAIAAAFGRFHTPVEIVVVAVLAGGALGIAPVCASGVVGLLTLWRGKVRQNMMVSIRGVKGRVVALSPWELDIESADGAQTSVPMLFLLREPIVKVATERATLRLVVERGAALAETMTRLQRHLESLSPGATANCIGFDSNSITVSASFARDSDLEPVVIALGSASLDVTVRSVTTAESAQSRAAVLVP